MSGMLSWFTSKAPVSNLPELTPLQDLRAKQIEQLRTFDANICELQRDVEYRVTVSDELALYIFLPPLFPQNKPVVRVSPPAHHPWIDERTVVTGCSSLNNFAVHSNLAKVVKEIVDEFRRNPPGLMSANITSNSFSAVSSSRALKPSPPLLSSSGAYVSASRNINTTLASSHQMAANPLHSVTMKTETSTAFPELKDLTIDALQELLQNEEKLSQLVSLRADQYRQSIQQSRELLERTARENVAKKALMEDKKRIVLEKYEALNDLRRKFDEQMRRQEDLHSKYDLSVVRDNLRIAAVQSEEKTEQIAEHFLDGLITVDEFTKNFMAERTLCHSRRAKEEKLSQAICQRPRPF